MPPERRQLKNQLNHKPRKDRLDRMMTEKQVNQFIAQLANPENKNRAQQMIDVFAGYKEGDNENYAQLSQEIISRIEHGVVDSDVKNKQKKLDELVEQIMQSPMRPATFIEAFKIKGKAAMTAMVVMDSSEIAYVAVPKQDMAKSLKLGDRVIVDGKATIMVAEPVQEFQYGSEVRYERKINDRHIEVITHQDQKEVVLCAPDLLKEIEDEKVVPGQNLVIQKNGMVTTNAVTYERDGFSHFRFLDRGPIPDVIADRDIGSPPKIIGDVTRHIREEMTRPGLRRKFKLRPCKTALLCGVSGTGKTLSVQAIHHEMYAIMSELTDTPTDKLPPRVFRFRASQALSMWFGESDKNIDRFFDEVEQMADKRFTNPKGREFVLPVLVVMEEADGMGRGRGSAGNDVYDRVMTTTLQRLDPARSSLANRLIVFLSTTNEPGIVDPAFLRRIGGSVEVFGRLDQKGFAEVLRKHLDGLPLDNGGLKHAIKEIDEWLYTEEQPIVEIQVHGYRDSLAKFRRDFMTGALIERAVQEAATKAWEHAMEKEETGITVGQIQHALSRQVDSVVHQLSEANINRYTDMPEGAHVASLRRIKQPVAAK
jgi:ATP-dependent 26S proteasome regulatory subunit